MTKEALKRIIGENIRKQRISRNMTVDELAELLELTPGFVGLIERGRRGATIHNLYKLSEIFGVDVDKFTTDQHAPSLKVAEKNTAKAKRTKITSLIYQMNENELDFVITLIKNMKSLRIEKSDLNDIEDESDIPDNNDTDGSSDKMITYDTVQKKRSGRPKKNTPEKNETD